MFGGRETASGICLRLLFAITLTATVRYTERLIKNFLRSQNTYVTISQWPEVV